MPNPLVGSRAHGGGAPLLVMWGGQSLIVTRIVPQDALVSAHMKMISCIAAMPAANRPAVSMTGGHGMAK